MANPNIYKGLKEFTKEEAKSIGDSLNIDWNEIDLEQFRIGLGVELEHGTVRADTNVTDDNPIATGKIALAHLRELDDYYSRLESMESGSMIQKEKVFVGYNETVPKGVELKRDNTGKGRYYEVDNPKTDVIAPKHIWNRTASRAHFKEVKSGIKDLQSKVLPKQEWYKKLPNDLGYICGINNVVTTVLGKDMIPKGVEVT